MMAENQKSSKYLDKMDLRSFNLWEKRKHRRIPSQMDLELTARCNNNCRHCYINIPNDLKGLSEKELSLKEIESLVNEVVELGAIWCLLTGGEPLLRNDFFEIYVMLRNKGLLVSIFTNACLITERHVSLWKKHPPRDIEVTVYGATKHTYEKITRVPGSFEQFKSGLALLRQYSIPVRLKYVVMNSNLHEIQEIRKFCSNFTKDFYRFDPVLHFRYDRNPNKNAIIKKERISPEGIAKLEQNDSIRKEILRKSCSELINNQDVIIPRITPLINCTAGFDKFTVGYDGCLRLCQSLWHPSTMYDYRNGSIVHFWEVHVPKIRNLQNSKSASSVDCLTCSISNLCLNCPASSYLEVGELDSKIGYFCEVAHARARALQKYCLDY